MLSEINKISFFLPILTLTILCFDEFHAFKIAGSFIFDMYEEPKFDF